MMLLNQNLAHTNNSLSLMFHGMNIVLISHMVCHVTILLKIVGYDQLVAGLTKEIG